MTPLPQITALLSELHDGEPDAASRLMPLVHAELRRIAAVQFAHERPGHTLQPTELIQETYIRLIKPGTGPWNSRAHFFGVAARVMRQILVDYARAHNAKKRAGLLKRVDLDKALVYSFEKSKEILDLDVALNRLAQLSLRQSRVVELRYFGGLAVREAAEVLGIGISTVKADWALAKAWLERELKKAP
jgi:RNA polymerase sigma factor (TIGR02999 family)